MRSRFVVGLVSFLGIVACGGATSSENGNGSDGGASSSSSGGSSSGGTTCTKADVPGRRACVPAIAPPDTQLTLDVDASDGCLGCFTTLACKVAVEGSQIVIAMESTTCPPPGDQACPAVCQVPQAKCTIPALAAGEYDVKVTGEGDRPGLLPRKLVVSSLGTTAATCSLPTPGTPPPSLDGEKYAKSCSEDTDCMTATVGNLCQPCKCPNVAIAKTAQNAYEADARVTSATCEGDTRGLACAACAPQKAICQKANDALTGTCAIVPAL